MAYKKVIKNQAKELYVIENKTVEEIASILRIPWRTLMRWKKLYKWEDDCKTASNIGLAMEMQKAFFERIQKAIHEDKLTEPAVADSLYKTAKLMEKLLPKKIMLANIYNLLQDIVGYINAYVEDDVFANAFARYLPEISEYLRKKYNE